MLNLSLADSDNERKFDGRLFQKYFYLSEDIEIIECVNILTRKK